ncbi:DUF4844 domain-containing protein [Undibacterium sp. RuTC16W]|uniref:DUF4844 domain-containing protein n=1 Tax=Undibacterium sp. RuTC16W TaxID=3413048 RepID=UPI003BF1C59E
MQVRPNAVHQLQMLVKRDNFASDDFLYTGVIDPIFRAKLNSQFNSVVANFISAVERQYSKKEYLALLVSEIEKFNRAELDTEDAEQVATNFEKIMDCIGLESSEGALNEWMYGFNPNKF